MRQQPAIVAVIQDGQGRFLVTFNAKWGGYAFPMIAVPEGGDILGSLAIQAVEGDLGCRLPNATAAELDFMSRFGVSQRSGEETLYEYQLYTVEPNQPLDLFAAPTWNNNPPMFLSYEELTIRTDLTWSTSAIVQEFVENQEVWQDTREIRAGKEWEEQIADGLRSTQVVIALLSPHAVRRSTDPNSPDNVDSVCLDELTFARFTTPPTPIVPVMAIPCEPPFPVFRLDYVAITKWMHSEDEYRLGFQRKINDILCLQLQRWPMPN